MRILSFHLCGKTAHFRRYYSNSSALTYSIPPRTTVVGMIAGLLGYERDSYYSLFSLDICKIAIASRSPLKKNIQKLNLLKVEHVNDLNGSQPYPSQTATEFVLPQNVREGRLDYQIWFTHQDETIMNRLQTLLEASKDAPWYCSEGISLALGGANHPGWLEYEGVLEGQEVKEEAEVTLISAVPVRSIRHIKVDTSHSYRLVKEDMPIEFSIDRKLTSRGKADVMINLLGTSIPVVVDEYVRLIDRQEAITWIM